MGADCKSVGLAFEGSNPSPATHGTTASDPFRVGGRRRFYRVGARALAVAVRSSGSPPRKSQPNAMSTLRVHRTVTSAPSVSADHESRASRPSASWSATAAWAAETDGAEVTVRCTRYAEIAFGWLFLGGEPLERTATASARAPTAP